MEKLKRIILVGDRAAAKPWLDALERTSAPFRTSVFDPRAGGGLPGGAADLVIFTSRARRAAGLERLAENAAFTIIEPGFFKTFADIRVAERLAGRRGCRISFQRRLAPFYKRLKRRLAGVHKLDFTVTGAEWDIRRDAPGFVDLLAFLIGQPKMFFYPGGAPGVVRGVTSRVCTIEFVSHAAGAAPLTMQLSCAGLCALVREREGAAVIAESAGDWSPKRLRFNSPPFERTVAAELTRLLDSGECDMTRLGDFLLWAPEFLAAAAPLS